MIKFIDGAITKVVSSFAEFVARAKGRNNFSLGANILAWAAISLGIFGVIDAVGRGSWRMGGGIVALTTFGILVAGLWEAWGALEYAGGVNPSESSNIPRVSHVKLYREHVAVRVMRVLYTGMVCAMMIMLPQGTEKFGVTAVLVAVFFTALWLVIYLPTVNKDRIRPHLYALLQ